MKPFIEKHKFLIGIFAVAVVARALLLLWVYEANDRDLKAAITASDSYYEISQNLLAGNGFSKFPEPPFIPDSIRAPLYTLFVAGTAAVFGYAGTIALQLLLGSLIPILGFFVLQRLTGEKKIALAVAWFLALEPFGAWLSVALLTETLFTVLFLSCLLFFLRYLEQPDYQNACISGVLLGLTTLVKPTTQYLPVVLTLLAAWHFRARLSKRLLYQGLIFLALFVAVLFPWLYRNALVFGTARLTVQPVANLYSYLVPSSIALQTGVGFEQARQAFFKREGVQDTDAVDLSNDSFYKTRAFNTLKDYKLGLLKSLTVSFVTFFTHDGYLTVLQRLGYLEDVSWKVSGLSLIFSEPGVVLRMLRDIAASPGIFVVIGKGFWYILALATLLGWYRFVKEKRTLLPAAALLVTLLLLYFAATTVINGLAVNARFRFPVNTFVYFLAFYGVWSFWQTYRNRSVAEKLSR